MNSNANFMSFPTQSVCTSTYAGMKGTIQSSRVLVIRSSLLGEGDMRGERVEEVVFREAQVEQLQVSVFVPLLALRQGLVALEQGSHDDSLRSPHLYKHMMTSCHYTDQHK